MKDKDGIEDFIVQLSKFHTDKARLEAFEKFFRLPSHACQPRSYSRIFKAITPLCTPDSKSEEVSKAALKCGLNLIQSDTTESISSSGGLLQFLESCRKILNALKNQSEDLNEGRKSSDRIALAQICFQILCAASTSSLLKTFSVKTGATEFVDIIRFGLKYQELKILALQLCEHGISVSPCSNQGRTISDRTAELMEVVYPFLFDDDQSTRKAALSTLRKMDLKTRPPSWKKMKQITADEYCGKMTRMVTDGKKDWPEIWSFTVNLYGEELLSGSNLINKILQVVERGYKHEDINWTRVQAFHCWKTLIDNFKNGLSVKKRMDLILIPLRAANHRTEALAAAKLNTYAHLLNTIANLPSMEPEVVTHFVTFCFGSENHVESYHPVKSYPALHNECSKTFELVLDFCRNSEFFLRVYGHVIRGTGECIFLNIVDTVFVSRIWSSLLGIMKTCEESVQYKNQVKKLFDVLEWLMQRSNERLELGSLFVTPILYKLVIGEVSLKRSIFTNATIYSGSSDLMEGTPALQIMEWLLEHCVLLGVRGKREYIDLVIEIIKVVGDSPAGFLTFVQSLLKKMQCSAEKAMIFMADQNCLSVFGSLTQVWICLVKEVVNFVSQGGEINQGDAAQHDFHCVYSLLLYPAQHLYPYAACLAECSSLWRRAFDEFSKQAALVATASSHEFCEQVTNNLAVIVGGTTSPKQLAAVYHFLACVVRVESGDGQKYSKKWSHIQNLVADVLIKLVQFGLGKEESFLEAAACLCSCLHPPTSSYDVLEKMSKVLLVLLKEKYYTFEPIDKVFDVFRAFKDTVVHMKQLSKDCRGRLKSVLEPVISAGQIHASQKLRGATLDLKDTLEGRKTCDDSQDSGINCISGISGSMLHLGSSPLKLSPGIPSSLPKGEVSSGKPKPSRVQKNKMQPPVPLSEFVRIETPPKKIVLTDHQKEVMKERRQDIPALYQDLTQSTQSMSQDSSQEVLALPLTPNRNSKLSTLDVDENAVMDVEDVNVSVEALTLEKSTTASPLKKHTSQIGIVEDSSKNFSPPSGFVLPLLGSDHKKETSVLISLDSSVEKKENKSAPKISPNTSRVVSPHRRKASVPVKKDPTVTRSSISSQKTKTRSGRVIKRLSLANTNTKTHKKSARKSLPVSFMEDQNGSTKSDTSFSESDAVPVTESDTDVQKKKEEKKGKKGEPDLPRLAVSPLKICRTPSVPNCAPEKCSEGETIMENVTVSLSAPETNGQKPGVKTLGGKTLKRSHSNSSLDPPTAVDISKPRKILKSTEVSDSQDVIESSQEPVGKVMKPCAVSLEPFEDPKPNGKVELSNVILVKGPDAGSPFKVLIASDQGDKAANMARRVLSMDGPVGQQSPSVLINLQVSETGTPLGVDVNGDVESAQGNEKPSGKMNGSIILSQSPKRMELNLSILPSKDSGCEKVHTNAESPVKDSAQKPPRRLDMGSDEDKHGSPAKGDDIPVSSRTLPEWMHEKKTSPAGKGLRSALRNTRFRSQAFLKPITESEAPASPPKGSDASRAASPNSSKKVPKSNADSHSNVSPMMKRSGRAAQLLGLGQAAAARGGDHVMPGRSERNEDLETLSDVNSSPDKTLSNSSAAPPMMLNSTASSAQENVPASPSVCNRTKFVKIQRSEMESPKACPSKTLNDEGIHEDWIPKVPLTATPNSILKRRRDADCEVQSPRSKRKRVSFTDPPLTSLLSFHDESQGHGTLISANRREGGIECGKESSVKSNALNNPNNYIEISTDGKSRRRENMHLVNGDFASLTIPKGDVEGAGELPKEQQKLVSQPEISNSQLDCVEERSALQSNPMLGTADVEMKETKHTQKTMTRQSQGKHLSNCGPENAAASKTSPPRKLRNSSQEMLMDDSGVEVKDNANCKVTPDSPRRSERNVVQLTYCEVGNEKDKVQKKEERSPIKTSSPSKEKKEDQKKGDTSPRKPTSPEKNVIKTATNGATPPPNVASGVAKVNRNVFKEPGSFEKDEETQGLLEDLVQDAPSFDPVFPNLMKCEHPIDKVVPDLTTAAWCKSLLKELLQKDIKTVGNLASLTEERINRLKIKSPKLETIIRTLKNFEARHDQKPFYISSCGISKIRSVPSSKNVKVLQDVLSEFPTEDVLKVVANSCEESELCGSISSKSLLEILINRLGANGVLNELTKHNEKEIFQAVLKRAKPDDICEMLKAEDFAAAISAQKQLLRWIHPDVVAETYVSHIEKTSGKIEHAMSLQQLSNLMTKINPKNLKELVCPSESSRQPLIGLDELGDFVVKEANLKDLPVNSIDIIKKFALEVTSVNDLAKHVLQGINDGNVSSDNLHLIMDTIVPKLNEKKLLRLLCETGLKFL